MTLLQKVWERRSAAEGNSSRLRARQAGLLRACSRVPWGGLYRDPLLFTHTNLLSQPRAREVHSGLDRQEACAGDHSPTETRLLSPEPVSWPRTQLSLNRCHLAEDLEVR